MSKTPLQPSSSRTYVVQVYTGDYSKISFRKFILPEAIENTCDKATTYFYQQDLFSCGESAYPIEMHSDISEMQPGFVLQN